jgi:two-component system, OmpR family, sensor kinase
MGRLFWKFFLFIWLIQLAGMFAAGAIFWFERRQDEAHWHKENPDAVESFAMQPPPGDHFSHEHPVGPLPNLLPDHRPPEPPEHATPRTHQHGPDGPDGPPHLPLIPLLCALIGSLLCALALAWYIAKPIRRLREAFDAAANGHLDVRIGAGMGGRRDELADLGRDFDRMSERLEALVDGQKRLLHDVSHEMRSPLARLQAAIGLARQQPARLEDTLARIELEGERMNALVGELLTLSSLEAGVTGEQEMVDLGELLAAVVDDARFEGATRKVSVDFKAEETPEIMANPELLHRAIENVVRNALRFSPEGGVVKIEAVRLGESIRLQVSDSGPGVPESELESIFQPFYRSGEQSSGGGYGLGLAIAKRVIAAINGKILAKNANQGGLVVEVVLNFTV